jgi:hypothetical protein
LTDLPIEFETLVKAGSLLKNFAGAILIGPEVGIGDLFLQLVNLALLVFSVKETSARPRCEL